MANNSSTVPAQWFANVVKLLNEMAGEGVTMQGCEDPADLMCEIADHLGVGQNDDSWNDAVVEAANHAQ